MPDKNGIHSYAPFLPPNPENLTKSRPKQKYPSDKKPRKPDWLLLLISALMLLTLLIAWFVDIPGLFH